MTDVPVRSYGRANQELAASFKRYLEARGVSPNTVRHYHADTVTRFVEFLGAGSVAAADRQAIRAFLSSFHSRSCGASALARHAAALRAFFKFLALTGLTFENPTCQLGYRKIPGRLPRVLTIAEVEALIAAARDPFERAVVEVLYSTDVRVSELCNLRVENIDFSERIVKVIRGKGGKDRYVLFGQPAAVAMRDYLDWNPPEAGYLFEGPKWCGGIFLKKQRFRAHRWYARFYANGQMRSIYVGDMNSLPTETDARREFRRIAAGIPGYHPHPARHYTDRAIANVINRLAHRAKLGRVHPHMLRRAMACHMLSGGANIRAIQDLLGHENIGTTQIYTTLTAQELKAVHQRCHPHEQRDGGSHAEKE